MVLHLPPHACQLQTSQVNVYRLVTTKTYEAEMFRRASHKLGLAQAVFESGGIQVGAAIFLYVAQPALPVGSQRDAPRGCALQRLRRPPPRFFVLAVDLHVVHPCAPLCSPGTQQRSFRADAPSGPTGGLANLMKMDKNKVRSCARARKPPPPP